MTKETYFATAAQVLPTILIALAVEANSLLRQVRNALYGAFDRVVAAQENLKRESNAADIENEAGAEHQAELDSALQAASWHQQSANEVQRRALIIGLTFMMGELSAVSSLLFGAGARLFPTFPLWWVTAPISMTALVLLSLLAATLPRYNLPRLQNLNYLISSPVTSSEALTELIMRDVRRAQVDRVRRTD
ncbi:hypothetical protein ACQP2Y_12505 [Actinoplanes sp. CA-051413]|uniref:hypothetical protein n=1 Tax=Actinoplanes sp. CA-051413 TaxID=3239899 RepID=UPI003D9592A6